MMIKFYIAVLSSVGFTSACFICKPNYERICFRFDLSIVFATRERVSQRLKCGFN